MTGEIKQLIISTHQQSGGSLDIVDQTMITMAILVDGDIEEATHLSALLLKGNETMRCMNGPAKVTFMFEE